MSFNCPRAQVRGGYSFSWGLEFRGMVNGNQSRMCFFPGTLNKRSVSRNQRYANNHDTLVSFMIQEKSPSFYICCSQVKDYSRKRWLILSLLSVEIDMMITWLTPLDLADREMTVLQVLLKRLSSSSSI